MQRPGSFSQAEIRRQEEASGVSGAQFSGKRLAMMISVGTPMRTITFVLRSAFGVEASISQVW